MKPSIEELERLIYNHEQAIHRGSIWKNKKTGGLYWVDRIAINESDLQPAVVYAPKYSDVRFVRPVKEWREKFESQM